MIFDLFFSEQILSNLRFDLPENPLFELIFVKNTGAAFSILENYSLFLIIFSIIALSAVICYMVRNVDKFSVFALK